MTCLKFLLKTGNKTENIAHLLYDCQRQKSKNRLIENLKRFTFEITAFNKDLAKVTIGGINLDDVNPKTMESSLTPNLYFAGEVLDLHGPTGGYNLKIAFSTGYFVGINDIKIDIALEERPSGDVLNTSEIYNKVNPSVVGIF